MDESRKTVVIVDDDEDLLRLLATAFRSNNKEVAEFKNGHEAREYLLKEENAKKIALLVLDRILPDMDGVEILKELREKNLSSYPVLILSSLSSEKDVLEGLSKGAVDYISKPFNMNILMQKANQLMK